MENNNGFGAFLERLEKKNKLLFRNFYPAFVLEFSFLAVILMLWVLKALFGEFSYLKTAISCFEPLELILCCILLPLILGLMHFRINRKARNYIFFKSLGLILAACMPLTFLVSTLNDLLFTALFSQRASVSPQMMLVLLVACALITIFFGLLFQMILIFIRARNE